MLKRVRETAYAKINLTLDILGRRADGYHDVRMIMQQISLSDMIDLSLTGSGISVSCNRPWVPTDNRNLAVKAAERFMEYTGGNSGATIVIQKNIPVAAGLAGGSADAAAVLMGLNRITGAGLSEDELCTIGAEIGADVPFCIRGGTALAEGIGERLTAMRGMPACYIVVAKPRISVSTPRAYACFDECTDIHRPDTEKCLEAIENGDIASLAAGMNNVFEDCVDIPENDVIKKILMGNGAIIAQMTGSGPTVFGIFNSQEDAFRARNDVRRIAPFAYVCTPVNK